MTRCLLALLLSLVSLSAIAGPAFREGGLPPGLVKKLERGEPLPPGWARRYESGDHLDRRLLERGEIVERSEAGVLDVIIEDERFRVVEDTLEILDIVLSGADAG